MERPTRTCAPACRSMAYNARPTAHSAQHSTAAQRRSTSAAAAMRCHRSATQHCASSPTRCTPRCPRPHLHRNWAQLSPPWPPTRRRFALPRPHPCALVLETACMHATVRYGARLRGRLRRRAVCEGAGTLLPAIVAARCFRHAQRAGQQHALLAQQQHAPGTHRSLPDFRHNRYARSTRPFRALRPPLRGSALLCVRRALRRRQGLEDDQLAPYRNTVPPPRRASKQQNTHMRAHARAHTHERRELGD